MSLEVLYTDPLAAVGDVVKSVIATVIRLFQIPYETSNIFSVIIKTSQKRPPFRSGRGHGHIYA